jgi:hypothetical protein
LADNDYFAKKDAKDLASHLEQRIGDFGNYISRVGLKGRWEKSYQLYYGRHFSGTYSSNMGQGGIGEAGENGELKLLTVNHYRNFIKHILVLTTNQKPAFDVRAVNSDLESLQQARLGNNVLDAYLKEKRLYRYLRDAAEHALVFGKGFIELSWEPTAGREYMVSEEMDPETGESRPKIVYEGDVEAGNPSPFDVYCDQSCEDWSKVKWVTIRCFKNKYDLAERYSHVRDEILDLPTKSDLDRSMANSFSNVDETADVPVFKFYHERTPSMPNGRYMLFCTSGTVLYDGPIPYSKLPVFRITPGDVFGTTEGYTDAFDIMPIQEAINVLASTVFSNESALGVQNILVPNGSAITAEELAKGLRIINYDPNMGKPEPLQLTNTPAEIFKFMEILERWGETLSGVNSVARGNPDTSLKSGVALGLIQSMAVQFASGFQQSWAELLEDSASFILHLLKDFASTERMVAMAGKHNRGSMQSFNKDKLSKVDRVVVELGNPMARTTAGRVEIANNLLQQGLVKQPQEYLQVMNTGQLDPLTEGVQSEIDLIRQENEAMMNGKPVKAMVGDSHLLHMQEHKALLSNPEVRLNAPLVQEVLEHLQEHMEIYKNQDPLWSQIAGEPPAPPPMMPPPPPGAEMNGPPPPGPPGPPMQGPPPQMGGAMGPPPGPMDGIPMPPPPEMGA